MERFMRNVLEQGCCEREVGRSAGGFAGEIEGEQPEGLIAEVAYGEVSEDGLGSVQVSIEHNDVDDWLAELDMHTVGLVRVCKIGEMRQGTATSDIYVVAGFLDEMAVLIELIYRCENLDYHGILSEGTEEAADVVGKIKSHCSECGIEVLGGRFKVK